MAAFNKEDSGIGGSSLDGQKGVDADGGATSFHLLSLHVQI